MESSRARKLVLAISVMLFSAALGTSLWLGLQNRTLWLAFIAVLGFGGVNLAIGWVLMTRDLWKWVVPAHDRAPQLRLLQGAIGAMIMLGSPLILLIWTVLMMVMLW